MIVWLRLAWTAVALILVTLVLAPWQAFAHWTGLVDPTWAPRQWYRIAARVLRLRIHVFGQVETRRPLLIASNHISWTDVIVLGSIFKGSFIAKGEVGGWPVVGPLARLQGTVLVDRASRRSAGSQVSELAASLAGGRAMLLFAEGTTSDGTNILPFKTTLFGAPRAAVAEAGAERVLIQPVAIAYTRLGGLVMGRGERLRISWTGDEALWPHLMRLIALPPLDVEVRWGEPIPFSAGDDRKQAALATHAQVAAMFKTALGHRPAPAVEAALESR